VYIYGFEWPDSRCADADKLFGWVSMVLVHRLPRKRAIGLAVCGSHVPAKLHIRPCRDLSLDPVREAAKERLRGCAV